jgi:hypothetical protein
MQIKLEVLGEEVINYVNKAGKPCSFAVLNCREASPATLVQPVRLSRQGFPTVVVGSTVVVAVTEGDKPPKSPYLSVRGTLVAAGK